MVDPKWSFLQRPFDESVGPEEFQYLEQTDYPVNKTDLFSRWVLLFVKANSNSSLLYRFFSLRNLFMQ